MAAEDVLDLANTNGGHGPPTPLLREIEARLAEVDAFPPGELVVGLWTWEDVCVIAVAGEMDMSNAAEITELLTGCLGSGPCRLVVEMSRLTFIDSTGLNQLITMARPLKARGGETLIAAPTAHVARVFQIVQLDELLTVVGSLESALSRVAVGEAVAEPVAEAQRSSPLSQLNVQPSA